MGQVSTVGIDLAKSVIPVHGADASGAVMIRKKLRRDEILAMLSTLLQCVVAVEACASAHHLARDRRIGARHEAGERLPAHGNLFE
jgi:transposase